MISVRDAFDTMMQGILPRGGKENIILTSNINQTVSRLLGRVLAEPVTASLTIPQAAMSAMDGYALRHQDITTVPGELSIVGTSHAGKPFAGAIKTGEAIKIFTGGLLPKNADAIAIIENTEQRDNMVVIKQQPIKDNFIRPAGLDFKKGEVLIDANQPITTRAIGLIIASGQKKITVHRKPKIGILSTGDELQTVGKKLQPHQIYPTNSYSLFALITNAGGEAIDLGVARDKPAELAKQLQRGKNCDMIITTGGASVGEKDFIKHVIEEKKYGLKGQIDFWKIAMRPGKPIVVGNLHGGQTHFLGLPGNPVSAMIGGLLFIPAMIKKWQGLPPRLLDDDAVSMPLATPLAANGDRQDYMRATVNNGKVTPSPTQDSSMLKFLHDSDGFIIRPPYDGAKKIGEAVMFLPLNQFHLY